MAGDWIKFELSTFEKTEVYQIADLANIDEDAALGKLLRVWGWFDQQTENGNAHSVSKRLLDRLSGVAGFCDCMIKAGWMTEYEEGEETFISLPNFDRHNGKTAKNRALTAKRVALHKANASLTQDALPREEKRREEKIEIKEESKDSCVDDRFARFWKLYPKKQGRAASEKAWQKIKMTDELYETIIQALAIQSQSKDWTKENGQYIPNGSTWLNGKRWEDEVKQSTQSRHNGFSTTDYLAGVELDEFGQATI